MGFNHIMVDEGRDDTYSPENIKRSFNHIMVDEGLHSYTSWPCRSSSFNHIMVDEGHPTMVDEKGENNNERSL